MTVALREDIERNKKEKRPLAVWDPKEQKVAFISPGAALRKHDKEVGSRN